MSDDIEMIMDLGNNTDGTSYIESLSKCRKLLQDSLLLVKLDSVISAELDLAFMSANKAINEIRKENIKDNVKAIK